MEKEKNSKGKPESLREKYDGLAERVETLSRAVEILRARVEGDGARELQPIAESERDPFFSALSHAFHPVMYRYFKECSEDNLYRVLNHQRNYPCRKLQPAEGLSQIKVLRVVYCLAKVAFGVPLEEIPVPERRYREASEDIVRSWICGLLERINLPESSRPGTGGKTAWAAFRDRRATFHEEFASPKRRREIVDLRNAFNEIALAISRQRVLWDKKL